MVSAWKRGEGVDTDVGEEFLDQISEFHLHDVRDESASMTVGYAG